MNRYEVEILQRLAGLVITFFTILLLTQLVPVRTVKGIKNYEPAQISTEKPYFEFGY